MRERPIIFSGEMVRAILSGRKTQTRRLVAADARDSFVRVGGFHAGIDRTDLFTFRPHDWDTVRDGKGDPRPDYALKCPYGQVGDRLWVRESFDFIPCGDPGTPNNCEIVYWQDGSAETRSAPKEYKPLIYGQARVRPSIHMPRWASRLTLEVTDVRVERLQRISEDDARAEGVDPYECPGGPAAPSYRGAFCELWDRINGAKHPWSSNPWAFVVSFKRIGGENA